MKISVVTATLNRCETIEAAIKSVEDQSYTNVEHVIQDGGSTDGTLELISSHARPNMKLESASDSGIYDAINRGISRSTGDIIGLLHSDDFFAHDDVLAQVAESLQATDAAGVYGDLEYVAPSNVNQVIRRWRAGKFSHKSLRRGWMPPHPTVYLRKEVFENIGLYDTSFAISADYDAMLRVFSSPTSHLNYIPEVLVKMRAGGASNSSVRNILLKSQEDLRAVRRNDIGGLPTVLAKNLSKVSQFF